MNDTFKEIFGNIKIPGTVEETMTDEEFEALKVEMIESYYVMQRLQEKYRKQTGQFFNPAHYAKPKEVPEKPEIKTHRAIVALVRKAGHEGLFIESIVFRWDDKYSCKGKTLIGSEVSASLAVNDVAG